ncbi:plasma membrane guanine and adenine transmembrane transporter [Schizosaccharomyces pombe]|uniref:Putative xanthine/uracil permease C887.17 n=1 Tax=Schizosaccharomyces pombe (strain 972 / ATCC 24843) TaxID=284812 RepID=YOOH_SCHPO|nr:putative transmembrane transporter [Schizosaccharomyces pombe]O94300.1 RecName: Full=Putative xanthine/uracil permease C887.17 [Schizosaccharomyces pombe 972h-]CAA21902.1 transmembrane transporter (predicted) [Schizosaccharomyces pombe]|eukprot:NP_596491.1 putative transmembrane transporter [Schizosaccharomyces pombe]
MSITQKVRNWVEEFDVIVARSAFGRWFRLEGCGHPRERKGSRFSLEISAGLTTFFAMAYILAVNATILVDTGGTCECTEANRDDCDKLDDYVLCKEDFHRDLVTATAAISALASFCMGLFANMPVGMAPGMGLNAYFAYQVVGYNGTGRVSYREALLAVFVEGFIFTGLTVIGLRQWLARVIPASLKFATGAGIGLYLTIIGLSPSAGLGVIGHSSSDIVALGGCPPEYLNADYSCNGHQLQSGRMWVGIFCGGVLTAILMMYKFKGAVLAGIALVTITSWPRRSLVTMFPHTLTGDYNFDFFKKVVSFRKINRILVAQQWNVTGGQFAIALITFLYVDIMDMTGTLYSMANYAGLVDPRTQDFEGSAVAYIVDALSISIGSLFGCSPVTAFIESGSGISAGGRTGILGMVVGICFFISLFFAPIFSSIPVWATGSTLVLVGSMMMKSTTLINWSYLGDSIPAFITIALMPFTYSIAYGLIAGIICYALLNSIIYAIDKMSRGRLVPADYNQKEAWTWRVEGGLLPQWVRRLFKGNRRFWEDPDDRKAMDNATLEMATSRSYSEDGKNEKTTHEDVTMKETSLKKMDDERISVDEAVGESESFSNRQQDFRTPYAGIDMDTDDRI